MQKIWQVKERLDGDIWRHILLSRGLSDEDRLGRFINPSLSQLISPTEWPQMEDAVARIWQAIDAGEKIVVWGDFDADGVTSTAIVWETLFELGADAMPYIPNRDLEGHGFSDAGIKELVNEGVGLVITVDHGITDFESIDQLQSLGIDVIVTDHHEPLQRAEGEGANAPEHGDSRSIALADSHTGSYVLPDCVAVIHPYLLPEPQKLAGCGTAYALAYAIWLQQKDSDSQDTEANRSKFAEGLIGLAALGTIADLMPLVGDNRVLAAVGLKALAQTHRTGLRELYRIAGITAGDRLSVYDVGYLVAPRLNAPGRLADALESLRLLCTRDGARAKTLASTLNDLNAERQELLQRVTKEAGKAIEQRGNLGAYVVQHEDWPAGVCGLAAGKLVEKLYRPVVVMERQRDMARGSARSIKGFDITAALRQISHLLGKFGGHAMAAGFSCKSEDVWEIERLLSEMVLSQMSEAELQPKLSIDADIGLNEVNQQLMENIKLLEPCGMGNPQPIFASRNVRVVESRAIGREGKHLKLKLDGQSDGNHSSTGALIAYDAVAFGFGHMADLLQRDRHIDVVYALDENTWNGRTSLQLKVRDLKILDE